MPSETFSQPIVKILDGNCEYEFYSSSKKEYSLTPSRICHIHLSTEVQGSQDVIMTIFTIRNQSGKWKIHSEGRERMDAGSMVPQKNVAVALAHQNNYSTLACENI